jgi:spore coat protein H
MRCGRWLSVTLCLLLAADAAPRDEADALFKADTVYAISIEIAPEAVAKLRADPRAYAPCTVREGDKVVSDKAGVKLKGAAGSFRPYDDRPALTVNLDKFGECEPWRGLSKFHLNNSVQDPSLLSEWLCSAILRDAGQPATRVAHAVVRINERAMGVYVLKESFDEDFLERNFASAKGDLYDGGFCQDLDAPLELDEGKGDGAALRALAEACREPDLKLRWSRIEQLVDVDAFVQFMALEAMLCHWDGYSFNSNNYRLYFEPDRKARFLAHGMDQCFQQPDMSVLDAPRAMLAASVMRNPEWRKDYRREIKKLLPKFSPQRAKRLVEPVQRRLSETLKEIDPELAASQLAESRALLERVAARARSLTAQSTAPEPKPLVFRKNTPVLVKDWRPMSEVDDAALETIDADGARWMRVACGPSGRCIAGWRRGVLLAKGKYVLEAVVRTEAVGRLEEEGAPGAGAGIRISGKTREGVGGTDGPRKIRFPFEVTEELADIELVIELRSAGGWAAFRVDSLVLERD